MLRRLFVLAVAAGWLLLLHMLLLAGAAPTVRTIRITLPGWPAGARDLRIAFLSDLHMSSPGDTPRRLAATIAKVNALHPDVVLLGGDLIANVAFARIYKPAQALAPLAALSAPLGIYAIFGNHDYWLSSKYVGQALIRLRITRLENDAVRIGPLAVVGIGDEFSHHSDASLALRRWRTVGGVPVVFTHSPDVVPALPAVVPLVLAGHTHCGQIRLPLIGALTTQSRYGRRYGCGVIREGARTTIVSAGLGLSGLPLRLGLGPDFWLVTVGR